MRSGRGLMWFCQIELVNTKSPELHIGFMWYVVHRSLMVRRCALLFLVMISCILTSGRGLTWKSGYAHISTTVCSFCFIFAKDNMLAHIHDRKTLNHISVHSGRGLIYFSQIKLLSEISRMTHWYVLWDIHIFSYEVHIPYHYCLPYYETYFMVYHMH